MPRIVARKRWLLTAVIAFVLLGHDALMVDAAHSAEAAASHPLDHARADHRASAEPLDQDDESPTPLDTDGCAAVRIALPRPAGPDADASGVVDACCPVSALTLAPVAPLGAAPRPPGSPPQVRRALLQVYRI